LAKCGSQNGNGGGASLTGRYLLPGERVSTVNRRDEGLEVARVRVRVPVPPITISPPAGPSHPAGSDWAIHEESLTGKSSTGRNPRRIPHGRAVHRAQPRRTPRGKSSNGRIHVDPLGSTLIPSVLHLHMTPRGRHLPHHTLYTPDITKEAKTREEEYSPPSRQIGGKTPQAPSQRTTQSASLLKADQ
jgi:hypothetical protein